jgi:hypothetical protein
MRKYRYPYDCRPQNIYEQIRQKQEEALIRELQKDDAHEAADEDYCTGPIIQITDYVSNPEFEAEARARIEAISVNHRKLDNKPIAKLEERTRDDWLYPW